MNKFTNTAVTFRDLTLERVAKISKKPIDEAQTGYNGLLELRHLHVQLDNAIRDPTAGKTSTSVTTSTKSKPWQKTTASVTPSAPPPVKKSSNGS